MIGNRDFTQFVTFNCPSMECHHFRENTCCRARLICRDKGSTGTERLVGTEFSLGKQ